MRVERFRLQFRVKLHTDEPRMVGTLDDFGQQAIGRHARENEALPLQRLDVLAVDLVAMAMAFLNLMR